jgi:hypothetical protein
MGGYMRETSSTPMSVFAEAICGPAIRTEPKCARLNCNQILATEPTPQTRSGAGYITRFLGPRVFATLLFCILAVDGQGAAEAWVRRYNSGEVGSTDYGHKVVTDDEGNVIAAGYTDDGITGRDILVIKYSSAGVALWTNRYNGPASFNDEADALAVDSSGNVFVTGYSHGSGVDSDYATLAYSAAGVALWTNRYNGQVNGQDQPSGLAIDNNGNVFVTGFSRGSGANMYDYVTIAYSGTGQPLWTNHYNGPANSSDQAKAVAVDNRGSIFVTGFSHGVGSAFDYATISYSVLPTS